MTDTRLVEAARDAIRAANLGKVDAMDAERREPPTCRTCEWCHVAPWPHGEGRRGVGWCESAVDWVDDLDGALDCSEWTPVAAHRTLPAIWDMRGRRVYLSGPMSGRPDMNRAAFRVAAEAFRDAGAAAVWDPSELADMSWFPCDGWTTTEREQAMREDLRELTRCDEQGLYYDMLVSLPGWQASAGATVERDAARAMGIPCVDLVDVRGLA